MNLLIYCVSNFGIDDVGTFRVNQFLYDGNDPFVDWFAFFVSKDNVDFQLCRICDDFVDKNSESNTFGAIVTDEANRSLDVNTLQLNFELTFLSNFLSKKMIIEIRSLDGGVDISGMYSKRMFPSDVENIGLPVDTNMLSKVGQIHGEMD